MKRVLTTAIGTGIIALFIFVQIGFAALTTSESQAGPVVSVELAYQTVSKGENFTVSIYVDPKGREIYGAQYNLYFANTLLNATAQAKGPFLGDNTVGIVNEINNTFNSTHGQLKYGETRIKLSDTTGVTEPGILANITFEAIAKEKGISELWLDKVKLYDSDAHKIENVTVNSGTVEIVQLPSPFLVSGYVFYDNGSECNHPSVNITNLNTGKEWQAETNASSNYYQLTLTTTDINAGEILRFNVASPDGKLSNITNYKITQDDIENGGLFNFNITPKAKSGIAIFDTGAPDSPYPSIMGVHNGTITPNRRIEVNRIYTYACPGTGGHTEYARIWGNGVDAHANWSGYTGNWHNLKFNTAFTLEPGKEYNYTIRTGSYPQIIHHPGVYNATGGKIICDEFTDANGKKYTGWIPAIKLWREEE